MDDGGGRIITTTTSYEDHAPCHQYTNTYPSRPAEMGFLESCFSYIFGDGDPNADIEEGG